MSINQLPTPPNRSQRPADLTTDTDAFLNALPNFVTQANDLANQVNNNAKNTSENAQTAAQDAITAKTFAGLSNYKGQWAAGTYAQGETVNHKGNYWINDVDGNTEEPGILNWSLVTQSKFEPSVKPTLKFDFARNEAIIYDGAENSFVSKSVTQAVTDGDLVVSNGASNVYDARGRLAPVSANKLRLSFNPETGESVGLLAGESRSSLSTYSEDFTSTWSGGVVTPNATTAPDGSLTADLVTLSDNEVLQTVYSSFDIGDTYVCSGFVKKDTGHLVSVGVGTACALSLNLDLGVIEDTGSSINSDIVELQNGWFFWYGSFSALSTVHGLRPLGDTPLSAGLSAYVWGYRLEKASFPSVYFKTLDVPVTKVADNIYRTLTTDEFNPYESTVYCEFYRYADMIDTNATAFALFDNVTGFDDAIYLNIEGSFAVIQNGNNILTKYGQSGLMNEGLNKAAISFNVQTNSAKAVLNGSVINLDNTGVLSARNLNRIQFGAGNLASGLLGHSHHGIPITEIYPKELSESECIALTGGA